MSHNDRCIEKSPNMVAQRNRSTQYSSPCVTQISGDQQKLQAKSMRVVLTRNRPTYSWVRTLLFAVPWAILLFERLYGAMYDCTVQFGSLDISNNAPITAGATKSKDPGMIPLEELTRTNVIPSCPINQTAVIDRHLPRSQVVSASRKIPKIIHQTSLRRCLMDEIANVTDTWKQRMDGWAYYFHDDVAVDRLFDKGWPEFPHLKEVSKCILYGAVKADLWRYLVLWEYGGLYSDIDASPALFNTSTITDDDDGFFVVEHSALLSQYFLALSPKHPLMYYAIQQSLANILRERDTGYINTPLATGPQALHEGFTDFMWDKGVKVPFHGHGKAIAAGYFVGTNNRSVRAVGEADFQDEYVLREAIDRRPKKKMYKTMNMAYFMDRERNGRSCHSVLFEARNSTFYR